MELVQVEEIRKLEGIRRDDLDHAILRNPYLQYPNTISWDKS
jgi:hypothetical protein